MHVLVFVNVNHKKWKRWNHWNVCYKNTKMDIVRCLPKALYISHRLSTSFRGALL